MWLPDKSKLVKIRLHNQGEDVETAWAEDLGLASRGKVTRRVRLGNVPFLHAKPTYGDVIEVQPDEKDGMLDWDRAGQSGGRRGGAEEPIDAGGIGALRRAFSGRCQHDCAAGGIRDPARIYARSANTAGNRSWGRRLLVKKVSAQAACPRPTIDPRSGMARWWV